MKSQFAHCKTPYLDTVSLLPTPPLNKPWGLIPLRTPSSWVESRLSQWNEAHGRKTSCAGGTVSRDTYRYPAWLAGTKAGSAHAVTNAASGYQQGERVCVSSFPQSCHCACAPRAFLV